MFENLFNKPAVIEFTERALSCDGGLPLLKANAKDMGMEKLGRVLPDRRRKKSVKHKKANLIFQRIVGLAAGYSDGNDFNVLRHDAVWKSVFGDEMPSQPTLSRLENDFCESDLDIMTQELMRIILQDVKRTRRKIHSVVLDMDGSDDPAYGQQQFSFFNGFYGNHCYLPLFLFATFNGETEQRFLGAKLRPGNSSPAGDGVYLLRKAIAKIKGVFPKINITVRLDGGFATPKIFDFLESCKVKYVVAMAGNKSLDRFSAPLLKKALSLSKKSKQSEKVFGDFYYQTSLSWKSPRRVVCKAEVLLHPDRDPKENPRYVVTNFSWNPERVYDFYCQRGDSENRIKELKLDLDSGRTSCTKFTANAFRLLASCAAYALLQRLRLRIPHHCEARRWQVSTMRLRLLKVAVWFRHSARRLLFSLPADFVGADVYRDLCTRLGAVPA